jgi:hypothetical protein
MKLAYVTMEAEKPKTCTLKQEDQGSQWCDSIWVQRLRAGGLLVIPRVQRPKNPEL